MSHQGHRETPKRHQEGTEEAPGAPARHPRSLGKAPKRHQEATRAADTDLVIADHENCNQKFVGDLGRGGRGSTEGSNDKITKALCAVTQGGGGGGGGGPLRI